MPGFPRSARLIVGALAADDPRIVWLPLTAWMKAKLLLPDMPPAIDMLPPGAVNSISCDTPSERIIAKLPLLKPSRLLS